MIDWSQQSLLIILFAFEEQYFFGLLAFADLLLQNTGNFKSENKRVLYQLRRAKTELFINAIIWVMEHGQFDDTNSPYGLIMTRKWKSLGTKCTICILYTIENALSHPFLWRRPVIKY